MRKQNSVANPPGAMVRRRFLQTAAAGATVSGITIVRPQSIRGSRANSKIRVGCIGLGGRGSWIASLFHAHGGYEVTALADYFPDVVQRSAQKLHVDPNRAFSGLLGYQRVLASGVDAVALETPPYFFPIHAEAAVKANCHVYVAKPVAIDVPGCLKIKALGQRATETKHVFLVDFQMRVDPYLLECIDRIRDGKMNTISFVRCFYDDEGRPDPPMTETLEDRLHHLIWTMNVCLGGDRIVCAGIHAMDAALWIVGEHPVRAVGTAVTCRRDPQGDSTDAYSLTYEFPGGAVMNYSGDQFRNYHPFLCGCDVYGWQSYMETRYGGHTWMRGADWRYEGGEKPDLYQWGAKENIAQFHRMIVGGQCSNVTVEPAVHANLACILGREAGRKRTSLTWMRMLEQATHLEPDLTGLVE